MRRQHFRFFGERSTRAVRNVPVPLVGITRILHPASSSSIRRSARHMVESQTIHGRLPLPALKLRKRALDSGNRARASRMIGVG